MHLAGLRRRRGGGWGGRGCRRRGARPWSKGGGDVAPKMQYRVYQNLPLVGKIGTT